MAGIDRYTLKPIDNLTHTLQCVEVILTTEIGTRVMRRHFGGGVAELLGRALTPRLFAVIQQLIAVAIDTWEPRLAVKRILFSGSTDVVRLGTAGIVIEADYRPGGLHDDFTVERSLSFSISFAQGRAQTSVI
ncbi:GPW/gp25 family protein [Roseibium album]|uniref:GPW/gp25 family protein n=1 Tax=Roseibium album TaxID=311410 RepID=UPI0018C96D54|nr:phage baseplate assembly protein W [Labrenzia sp. EL_126]